MRSSARSFTCTVYSLACSTLLLSLARSFTWLLDRGFQRAIRPPPCLSACSSSFTRLLSATCLPSASRFGSLARYWVHEKVDTWCFILKLFRINVNFLSVFLHFFFSKMFLLYINIHVFHLVSLLFYLLHFLVVFLFFHHSEFEMFSSIENRMFIFLFWVPYPIGNFSANAHGRSRITRS